MTGLKDRARYCLAQLVGEPNKFSDRVVIHPCIRPNLDHKKRDHF